MEKKTLEVVLRKEKTKGATNSLRREGKIPSIIYGHREPVAIAIDAREFNSKFKIISESTLIDLNVDGDTYSCIVKDYQENALRGNLTHIDFFEVEKGKTLKTHVPVHVEGTPEGVKEGGIFEVALHEVEIESLPKDLPEKIHVDVSALNIGNSLHVSDIVDIPGVKILTSGENLICTVTRKKEEKVAVEEDEEVAEEVADEAAADSGASEE